MEPAVTKDQLYFDCAKGYVESQNFFMNYKVFFDALQNCIISLPTLSANTATPSQIENCQKVQKIISSTLQLYSTLAGDLIYFITKTKLNNNFINGHSKEIISCENHEQLRLISIKSNAILENLENDMKEIDRKWKESLKALDDFYNKDLMAKVIENVKTNELSFLMEEKNLKIKEIEDATEKFQKELGIFLNQLVEAYREIAQFQAAKVSEESQINFFQGKKKEYQNKKNSLNSQLQSLENNILQNEQSYKQLLQEKTKELDEQKKNMEVSARKQKLQIQQEYENRLSGLRGRQSNEYQYFLNLPSRTSELCSYTTTSSRGWWWSYKTTNTEYYYKTVDNKAKREQEMKVNQIKTEIAEVEKAYQNILSTVDAFSQTESQEIQERSQKSLQIIKSNQQDFKEGFQKMKQFIKDDMNQLESRLDEVSGKLIQHLSEKEKNVQIMFGVQSKINKILDQIKTLEKDHESFLIKTRQKIEEKTNEIHEILERTGHHSEKAFIHFSEALLFFFQIAGEFKIKLSAVCAFIDTYTNFIKMNKSTMNALQASPAESKENFKDPQEVKKILLDWSKAFPSATEFRKVIEEGAIDFTSIYEFCQESSIEEIMQEFRLKKLQAMVFKKKIEKIPLEDGFNFKKKDILRHFEQIQSLTSLRNEKKIDEDLKSVKNN